MKIFYIQIIIRCYIMYFAILSMDIFRVLYLIFFEIFVSKIYISSIKLLLLYKVYGIAFAQECVHPSNVNNGHRPLSEANLAVRN